MRSEQGPKKIPAELSKLISRAVGNHAYGKGYELCKGDEEALRVFDMRWAKHEGRKEMLYGPNNPTAMHRKLSFECGDVYDPGTTEGRSRYIRLINLKPREVTKLKHFFETVENWPSEMEK